MPAATPAVVAVCCRLPEGCTRIQFDDWARPVQFAGIPVTWIVGPADLEAMAAWLAARGEQDRLAVDLPPEWFSADSRQSLVRQRFDAVRRIAPAVDTVVVRHALDATEVCSLRPEHLVEYGMRLAVTRTVGRWRGRKSRRPGPSGWACASPVWGLWEVGFTPRSPRGWLSSVLPLFLGPPLAPGGLAVIQAGMTDGLSKREGRQRFERIVHWVARCVTAGRPAAETVSLSRLATILGGGTASAAPRSVLAA